MATGTNFPASLDSFVNKIDFPNPGADLVLASETNTQSSAIEQIQRLVGTSAAFTSSTNYLASTEGVIYANALSNNITIDLPDVSTNSGKRYLIKKTDASTNQVILDPNSTQTIDGKASLTIFIENAVAYIESDGTEWKLLSNFHTELEIYSYPPSYIDGIGIIWESPSQITIQKGNCRDDLNTINISNLGSITVDITVSGPGGLDSGGETPDTWYYVWIISDSTETNPVSAILSLSSTSPTMPAGYDKKRRVGSIRNNSASNIIRFYLYGKSNDREYVYDTNKTEMTVLSAGGSVSRSTISLATIMPPTSNRVLLNCTFDNDNHGTFFYLFNTDSTETPATTIYQHGGFERDRNGHHLVWKTTDLSNQIDYAVTEVTDNLDIWGLSYKEFI
jgi:hypothetical protein